VQELMSGDGSKSDGGKQAAAEIQSDLGSHWVQTCVEFHSFANVM
jgi:hypothetical protein